MHNPKNKINGGYTSIMKKYISQTLSIFTIYTIFLTTAIASGPPPPLRTLPEGAKMRIGQGRGVDFAFSPDDKHIAIACSIIGIWVHDVNTGQEISLLAGHTDAVTSVEYSPDGKLLASGSYDKTVRLWDANTYELLTTFTGHKGDAKAIAFSPDGKTLASGVSRGSAIRRNNFWGEDDRVPVAIDSFIRLWDVVNKKQKMILNGHTGWVTALKFSPDGTILASASTDGTVRLWNTLNGKNLAILKGGGQGSNAVLFSPDSKQIATPSANATVRLWDTQTGKMIAIYQECQLDVMAFSPDSLTFLTGHGIENTVVRMWNTKTGKLKAALETKLNRVLSINISYDRFTLVSTEDQQNTTIQWWDLSKLNLNTDVKDTSKTLISPQKTIELPGVVPRLEFSPERSMLATWQRDVIQLWDADIGSQKANFKYPSLREHRNGRPFVLYSKDATTLACGDGTSKIWLFDGVTYKHRTTLYGHTTNVIAAAISPDGDTFASASEDGILRLWDMKTGQSIAELKGHTDAVSSLAFSSDSRTLASGSADKTIFLWDAITGKPLKMFVGHKDEVKRVLFPPDGRNTLASASGKKVRVWNTATGDLRFTLEVRHPWRSILPLAFSPDGQTLATGGEWNINLWDANTGKHKHKLSNHLDNNFYFTFSPDGKSLVSSGKTTQLWDVKTGENIATISKKSGAYPLLFSPDSNLLYGYFGIWDIQLRQRLKSFDGHRSEVTSMAISPTDGTFASASYDGTIVIWEPVQREDKKMTVNIVPSPEQTTIGKQQQYKIEIINGENVAGYQLTLQFDETRLRYISSSNGNFLPDNPFFIKPKLKKNQLTLAATALIGVGNGNGTLANVTFEILSETPSSIKITNLILSDKDGKRLRPLVKDMEEQKDETN